ASDAIDIEDGVVFFLTCYSNYGYTCFGTSSAAVSKVSDSGLGSEYPRSEVVYSNDHDGDGLQISDESIQGTSDRSKDHDGDGISDLQESESFSNRLQAYCNTAVTPAHCAYPDPLKKDLYVEIDSMYDQDNDILTQPTPNQLSKIGQAFEAQGIEAHFDIGDYTGDDDDEVDPTVQIGNYGGGNLAPFSELVVDASNDLDVPDLIDYKRGSSSISSALYENPQFDFDNRSKIWRYVLSAKIINAPTSSDYTLIYGQAAPGDDEALIAFSAITANSVDQGSFDRRYSRVIMHELGHTLCLSDGTISSSGNVDYDGQYNKCIFSKIDKKSEDAPVEDYISIMHYAVMDEMLYANGIRIEYPLPITSFSFGNGNNGDNDDWEGVLNGIKDFSKDKNHHYPITNCRLECY
ncbi:hypothetical protein JNJ66_00005, partial [Candidatus Saccharibacteria bacterium]|nr:hypothetical protein [Candidatus Saccharibacteria bacterium]